MAESKSAIPLAPASLGGNARNAAVNPNSDIKVKSLGEVLAAGAQDMAEAWKTDVVRRDRLEEVKQTAAYKARIAEEIDGLDPLADDYEEKLDETIIRSKDDFLGSTKFGTPQVRDEFAARLDSLAIGDKSIAMQKRRGALSDDAIRVRQESEDSAYAAIRQDPDGYDLYLTDFAENARKLNISIKPQLLPKMNGAFADQAVLARSEGFALAGRHDEAKAFLDDHQGVLDPNVFIGAKRRVREIENQQRQDRLSDTESQVADMEIRAIDAKDGATLTKLRAEVEGLNARGFFQGQEGKRVSLIRQIESQREQMINKNKDLNLALANFTSGTGVDSQKQADLAFDPVYARWKDTNPDAEIYDELNFAADYAAKSGFLPGKYKRLVENAERTENPQLLEAAARIHDRLAVTAPDVKSGIEEKGSRVRLTSVATELLGVGYDQAADMVIKRVPDQPTLKARGEQFDKDFPKLDMRDMLDSLDIFDDPKTVPDKVARDAERSLRLHYDMFGDKAVAQAAMKEQFKTLYGITAIGGGELAMKYPPERFNPIPARAATEMDNDFFPKAISADLRRSLEGAGVTPATPSIDGLLKKDLAVLGPSGEVNPKRGTVDVWSATVNGTPAYGLASDDVTESDLAAGRRPSYEVRVRNSYGQLVPIGQRYRVPDLGQLREFPEYKAAAGKSVEQATKKIGRAKVLEDVKKTPLTPDFMNPDIGMP